MAAVPTRDAALHDPKPPLALNDAYSGWKSQPRAALAAHIAAVPALGESLSPASATNGDAGAKNRGEQRRGDEAEVAELLPSAHALAQASPSGFDASSELAFPRSCRNPDVLFLNKVRGPGCSLGT